MAVAWLSAVPLCLFPVRNNIVSWSRVHMQPVTGASLYHANSEPDQTETQNLK